MDTINNNFCCSAMHAWLQDPDSPLQYEASIREYCFTVPRSLIKKNVVWPCYSVLYCPYCGTKLPTDLIEKWAEILRKEYGIEDPYDPKQKKLIPKEFLTDGWWKKRLL